jgi:hypothetical protein
VKIAFIGYGNVGAPLADQLQRAGHHVTLAADDSNGAGVKKARARNAHLEVAAPTAAVEAADVVFLATPFRANEQIAKSLGHALRGKTLVDCTNPVGAGLRHGLDSVHSGSEALQKWLPSTKVVKAFSIYGFENFENSAYPGHSVKPMMMYCGNDAAAKKTVAHLIEQLGWEPFDVGGIEQALHLEHMTLLWVRMVRVNGASPHMVWAALRR